MNKTDDELNRHTFYRTFVGCSTVKDVIFLQGKYDPNQLWLPLDQVFVFTEQLEEPPVVPTKRKFAKKRKWVPHAVDPEAYQIYNRVDYRKNNILPFENLRQVSHVYSEKINVEAAPKHRAKLIEWIEENTLDVWSIMSRRYEHDKFSFHSKEDGEKFAVIAAHLEIEDMIPAAEYLLSADAD